MVGRRRGKPAGAARGEMAHLSPAVPMPMVPLMRFVYYALFITIGGTLLFLVHRYLWRRLVRDPRLAGWGRRLGSAVVVGGGVIIPLTMALSRYVPRAYMEWLATAAFLWLGAVLYLVLLLLPWDIVRGFRWLHRRRGPALGVAAVPLVEPPPEPAPARVDTGRRVFLARVAAGTAALGTGGLVAIGVGNALGEVAINELEVKLDRLPPQLSGMRVVQISDVHIGAILDGRFIAAIKEKVESLKPDLFVITGDLVDASPAMIARDVAPLGDIQARFGTYFCTGNHEYYAGADPWIAALDKMGIQTLLNERVVVGDRGPGGATLDLAGIPDKQGGRFLEHHVLDWKRTLAGRDDERELLLLAHRPNPIHEATRHGVGLQLSGHTHGGQLWPITEATRLVHPYSAGLHKHEDKTWIHVSRGTGFWGPPMRLLAPSEITSIVLTA